MFRFVSLCLLLLLAQARFTSEEGRFAVTPTGQLEQITHPNDTPLGTVEEHIFRWRKPGLECVVNYSDVPSLVSGVEKLLYLEVRQGFRRTAGFPVTNDREESFAGHPGRAFDFRIKATKTRPQRSGVARVLLVEGRLYVLTVTWNTPELPADRSAAESFLGSFELLQAGGTPTKTPG